MGLPMKLVRRSSTMDWPMNLVRWSWTMGLLPMSLGRRCWPGLRWRSCFRNNHCTKTSTSGPTPRCMCRECRHRQPCYRRGTTPRSRHCWRSSCSGIGLATIYLSLLLRSGTYPAIWKRGAGCWCSSRRGRSPCCRRNGCEAEDAGYFGHYLNE
jgi:hypothetical protein